jgi:hypothetical protein
MLPSPSTFCQYLSMPSTLMIAKVDAWTVQAVASSRWLTQFYRSLGDDRQAATANQAGAPALERLNRLKIQSQAASLEKLFSEEFPDETLAEEAAWNSLVEALAGLSAFFAVTADPVGGEITPGLRGPRTATYSAYRKAVRGFQTAFPDEISDPGVSSATQKATAECVDALLNGLHEEDPAERDQLRAELETCVHEVLGKAVAA